MGVDASAASSPPEAAAPAADPPAKEDTQPAAAADAPPAAAAPADPPAKEPAAAADAPSEAADSPAKEEIQSAAAAYAPAGDAEMVVIDTAPEAGGEEEEAECGFCLYMKGGGCKEEFVEWEKCLEDAQEKGADVVEHCAQVTVALRSCMLVHEEYYEPILRVERRMSEDLEGAAEAEAEASQAFPASPPSLAAAEGEQGDNKKQAEVVVVVEKEDPAP